MLHTQGAESEGVQQNFVRRSEAEQQNFVRRSAAKHFAALSDNIKSLRLHQQNFVRRSAATNVPLPAQY